MIEFNMLNNFFVKILKIWQINKSFTKTNFKISKIN